MIDVKRKEYQIILSILRRYVPDCEIRVFGSRHRGNAKPTSDLDIAIVGPGKLDIMVMADLKEAFEESELSFRVDILDWHNLSVEFQKVIEEGYTPIVAREHID